MLQTRKSGPSPDRSTAPYPPASIPPPVHEVIEYETACAYADGYANGYAQALHDVLTWPEATGEKPRTFKGTLKWLVKDIDRRGVTT